MRSGKLFLARHRQTPCECPEVQVVAAVSVIFTSLPGAGKVFSGLSAQLYVPIFAVKLSGVLGAGGL